MSSSISLFSHLHFSICLSFYIYILLIVWYEKKLYSQIQNFNPLLIKIHQINFYFIFKYIYIYIYIIKIIYKYKFKKYIKKIKNLGGAVAPLGHMLVLPLSRDADKYNEIRVPFFGAKWKISELRVKWAQPIFRIFKSTQLELMISQIDSWVISCFDMCTR